MEVEGRIVTQLRVELEAAHDTPAIERWMIRSQVLVEAVFDKDAGVFLQELCRAASNQMASDSFSLADARATFGAFLDTLVSDA